MTVCNMTIEGGGARRHDRARRDDLRVVHRTERARAPKGAELERGDRGLVASCPPTRAPSSTPRSTIDAGAISPQVSWGTNPGMVRAVTESVPAPEEFDSARRPRGDRTGAALHGPRARHADRGDRPRPRLHRLVHQLRASATCAPPPRSSRAARCRAERQRDGRARLPAGARAGRSGGPRPGLPRGRLRLARGRLLDVPGHEPRHPAAGRALRLHLQPQLRGPPGPRRAHPPRSRRRWPPRPPIEGRFVDIREWS